jgi:hypothetical protein
MTKAKLQHKPKREVGIAPTPERLAKGDLVAGYTVENTRVYGDRRAMNPPLIDTLLERGWIDARAHGVAANYYNLTMREGAGSGYVGSAYGRVSGGGQSDDAAEAHTERLAIDRLLSQRIDAQAPALWRNVCVGLATLPGQGRPYWLARFVRCAGVVWIWTR